MKQGSSHEAACGSGGCVNTSKQYFLIISTIEVNTKYNSETIDTTRSMKKEEVCMCTCVLTHAKERHIERGSPEEYF